MLYCNIGFPVCNVLSRQRRVFHDYYFIVVLCVQYVGFSWMYVICYTVYIDDAPFMSSTVNITCHPLLLLSVYR